MLLARRTPAGAAGGAIAWSCIDGILQVDVFDDLRVRLRIGNNKDLRLTHVYHLPSRTKDLKLHSYTNLNNRIRQASTRYWLFPTTQLLYNSITPTMTLFSDKKLIVKNTKKYGKGVFAGRFIKRGEVIYLLSGERFTAKDFVAKIKSGKEYIDDPLQIGKRTYLDLDSLSRTFNHSCNPNSSLRKASELFAIRDINKGEEITYDYSLTIAPTKWNMKCVCGSENCRGVLGDVLSIPKKQLNYYKKANAMQSYMKLLLKKIEETGHYEMPKYELLLLEGLEGIKAE